MSKIKKSPEQLKQEKDRLNKLRLDATSLKESVIWVIGFPSNWIVNSNFTVKFERQILLTDQSGNILDTTKLQVKPDQYTKKSKAFMDIISSVQKGEWQEHHPTTARENWVYYSKTVS